MTPNIAMENSTLPPGNFLGGATYINLRPITAAIYLTIQSSACLVGTFGNILILTALAINKDMHKGRNMFLINLAVSDLLVTFFIQPMAIKGMVGGKALFDLAPGLCDVISTMCLIACVNSLLSIGGISFNQYFHICHPGLYKKVFNLRTYLAMICSFWIAGALTTIPLFVGWGRHTYDTKTLQCFWDRTASLSFAIFFSAGIVATPTVIISFSYGALYHHVLASKRRIQVSNGIDNNGASKNSGYEARQRSRTIKLAKSLFIIFLVFVGCWSPFALLVVLDHKDVAPHEVHLFITQLAHLHASANCIVYALTNSQMRRAYRTVFVRLRCIKVPVGGQDTSTHAVPTTSNNVVQNIQIVPENPSNNFRI